MSAKKAHDAARAKAAKEKKILLALAPLLAIAAFFAYHTMSKLHHSSAPPVTPAAATTPASSPAAATTPATTTPATATPATATPVAIETPAGGKLARLTLFAAKDPFHDQGPRVSSSSSSKSSSSKQSTKSKQSKSKPSQKAPATPPSAAVIAVNGRLMSVPVRAAFPVTNNPVTNGVFKLVGLTARSAKIAVAGGSYANGSRTLTLTVNSVVTLVNTADGKRYTLALYPPTTTVPGAPVTTPTTTTTGP